MWVGLGPKFLHCPHGSLGQAEVKPRLEPLGSERRAEHLKVELDGGRVVVLAPREVEKRIFVKVKRDVQIPAVTASQKDREGERTRS